MADPLSGSAMRSSRRPGPAAEEAVEDLNGEARRRRDARSRTSQHLFFFVATATGRERRDVRVCSMQQPIWNFEQEPFDEPSDETSVNLRAYFDRMPDEKMREYKPEWSDEEVIDWDGNFRDDGNLFLLCCERDVDVKEYRQVIAESLRYRDRVRDTLLRSPGRAE